MCLMWSDVPLPVGWHQLVIDRRFQPRLVVLRRPPANPPTSQSFAFHPVWIVFRPLAAGDGTQPPYRETNVGKRFGPVGP